MRKIVWMFLCLIGLMGAGFLSCAEENIGLGKQDIGMSVILNPGNYSEQAYQTARKALETSEASMDLKPEGEEDIYANLVMADVETSVNVRAEADENAEKIGLLYKDCGGTILEQAGEWTKIESGDVVGWVSNEYLLFGEEAKTLAQDVGNLIATSQADTLRVRKEPNTESGVFGLIGKYDELDVIEDVNEQWISVEFEDEVGYISKDYVEVEFYIDQGETIEAINEREAAEAAERAKLKAAQAAVTTSGDDVRLLAALIQCEAGREPYEGMLAVAAVVMNRVRSGAYPNSISGVVYASGQFPPALNGTVAKVYEGNVKSSCMQAAQAAINGETNVGTATHFRRAGSREGIVIGNHVFW